MPRNLKSLYGGHKPITCLTSPVTADCTDILPSQNHFYSVFSPACPSFSSSRSFLRCPCSGTVDFFVLRVVIGVSRSYVFMSPRNSIGKSWDRETIAFRLPSNAFKIVKALSRRICPRRFLVSRNSCRLSRKALIIIADKGY